MVTGSTVPRRAFQVLSGRCPPPGIAYLSGQREDRDHAHAVRQSMGYPTGYQRGGNDSGHRGRAGSDGSVGCAVGVRAAAGRPWVLSVEVDAATGVVVVRGSVDATAVRAALLEVGYLPEPLTG